VVVNHAVVAGSIQTAGALNQVGVYAVSGSGGGGSPTGNTEVELHHLLPRSEKLKPFFERAGLNIEEYKIPMDKAAHRLLPDGIHTGPFEESWNGVWVQYFKEYPKANAQQILVQLAKMRKAFGI
jgi:hypothetical protein